MKAGDRDPRVRCARKRPKCGHERREHGPNGKCYGVTFVEGVPGDCHCTSHIEPPDPPRFVREGENVDD